MKFLMLKALGVNLLLVFCMSVHLSAQTPQEEIINEFFKAFNNSDFDKLTEVISSDITITEGNFVLCNSIDQLKIVFQWDSVFVPEYKVLEMEVNGDVYDVVVSKIDKRVEFLHDIPMVSNVHFVFDGEHIKSQSIDNYTVFDVGKWRGSN